MNYNSIERVQPHWIQKWKRQLIKLGRSTGLILPKPLLTALGSRTGKFVYVGLVIDELTGKDMVVIEFE
jgi:hypothetical protein